MSLHKLTSDRESQATPGAIVNVMLQQHLRLDRQRAGAGARHPGLRIRPATAARASHVPLDCASQAGGFLRRRVAGRVFRRRNPPACDAQSSGTCDARAAVAGRIRNPGWRAPAPARCRSSQGAAAASRSRSRPALPGQARAAKGEAWTEIAGEDDDVSDDASSRSRFLPLTPISELLNRPYVTAKEAQRLVPCGNSKLYELIGSGELEVRKLGRRTLISTASIMKLHSSLPRAAIDRSDRAA